MVLVYSQLNNYKKAVVIIKVKKGEWGRGSGREKNRKVRN